MRVLSIADFESSHAYTAKGTSSTSKYRATCLLRHWRPWQASGILQVAIANTARFKSGRSTFHLSGEEVLVLAAYVDCNHSTLHMKPRYHVDYDSHWT